MTGLFEFVQGPLFTGCFVLFLLGLGRIAFIAVWGVLGDHDQEDAKAVPYQVRLKAVLDKLIAVKPFSARGKMYRIVSFIFHTCLVLVPLLLLDHILLWRRIGLWWPGLPERVSDWLTVVVIAGGIALLGYRAACGVIRRETSAADYAVLLLIEVIFITGYTASRPLSPISYDAAMLIHMVCGNALLALIPFTRPAHCFMYPLMRALLAVVTNICCKKKSENSNGLATGEAGKT
jgi:nitrate reductase gamma subunit